MARKCLIEKNKERVKSVNHYRERRMMLKNALAKPGLSQEERFRIQGKLQSLPRDASPVRVRNRCAMTGRARGVYRFCGLSRSELRNATFSGFLPGMKRSSW